MQASLASMTPGHHYFAPWDARVLQHLFLYPFLVLCALDPAHRLAAHVRALPRRSGWTCVFGSGAPD